jgi:hypothetical protein
MDIIAARCPYHKTMALAALGGAAPPRLPPDSFSFSALRALYLDLLRNFVRGLVFLLAAVIFGL